ncbi:hypothetical protein RKD37_002784 [Streptomyces ambofaciens]
MISFINAIAEVCETSGADVITLADILGHDARIGRRSMRPGLGGSCLPKDIRGFMARASELGVDQALTILREVDAINNRRRERMIDLTRQRPPGPVRAARPGQRTGPPAGGRSPDHPHRPGTGPVPCAPPEPGSKLVERRPLAPDRQAPCGILFVLHTGIQWKYLLEELGFGSCMTCWGRLAAWNEAGVRDELHLLRSAKKLD